MSYQDYVPPPVPDNEPERRAAVLRSGLLAMEDSVILRRLCQEAKIHFAADWASIVVILDGWQYVISATGEHAGSHRRSACITPYVIMTPKQVFYRLDAAEDKNLAASRFVSERLIVFYAGAAICDRSGYPVGVLCITNRQKRQNFLRREQAALMKLAGRVLPEASRPLGPRFRT